MPCIKLDVATERLPLAEPFRISGRVFEAADVVVVTLSDIWAGPAVWGA